MCKFHDELKIILLSLLIPVQSYYRLSIVQGSSDKCFPIEYDINIV